MSLHQGPIRSGSRDIDAESSETIKINGVDSQHMAVDFENRRYHHVSWMESFKTQVVWRIMSGRKRCCRIVAEGEERESRGERKREEEEEGRKKKPDLTKVPLKYFL